MDLVATKVLGGVPWADRKYLILFEDQREHVVVFDDYSFKVVIGRVPTSQSIRLTLEWVCSSLNTNHLITFGALSILNSLELIIPNNYDKILF